MWNNSYQINSNAKSSFSLSDVKQVFNNWIRKLLPIGQDLRDSPRGNQDLESSIPETANSDAVFLGWQKTAHGEVFALYTITAEQHPLYRSTVSEKTLHQQHLETPSTPAPQGKLKKFDHEK